MGTMIIFSDGYVPLKSEWDIYHDFKPSFLQKMVHAFFPLEFMIKWERYKNLKREDCQE